MSLIGTVLVEHSMLLLLKNRRTVAIGAAISIGVAMVAGSGSNYSVGINFNVNLLPVWTCAGTLPTHQLYYNILNVQETFLLISIYTSVFGVMGSLSFIFTPHCNV